MSTDDKDLHPNLADALAHEGAGTSPSVDDAEAIELDRIARLLGDLGEDSEPGPAPADLWSRIEAEAFGDVEGAPDHGGSAGAASPAEGASVTPIRSRRRRFVLAAVAAAAAVVLVVGFVVTGDDTAEPVTEEVVLEPLPGFDDAAGTATLVIDGEQRTVTVDLEGAEVPADHHLELWLLDEDVTEIISLGAIEGEEHTIPDDVDLTTTPVVDISLEPDDGDPAHSGVSIVRGVVTS